MLNSVEHEILNAHEYKHIKKFTFLGSDKLRIESNFAQMPISQDNKNVFWSDLITKVPESNYFIFMQTDYSRWPPGAVTENNIRTNLQYLKNHWLKLSSLCTRMSLV